MDGDWPCFCRPFPRTCLARWFLQGASYAPHQRIVVTVHVVHAVAIRAIMVLRGPYLPNRFVLAKSKSTKRLQIACCRLRVNLRQEVLWLRLFRRLLVILNRGTGHRSQGPTRALLARRASHWISAARLQLNEIDALHLRRLSLFHFFNWRFKCFALCV